MVCSYGGALGKSGVWNGELFSKPARVPFSASGFLARFARCGEPLGAKIYAKKAERSVFDLALSEPRRCAPRMLDRSVTDLY